MVKIPGNIMPPSNENYLQCPECGSGVDVDSLCECGYNPELEVSSVDYCPQYALTATLERSSDGKNNVFLNTLGQVWTLERDDVKQFITQIEKKFKRKRKVHGVIEKSNLPSSASEIFSKYLSGDKDFEGFVTAIMRLMTSEANQDKSNLSGGAIIFIHYKVDEDESSNGRLFIIMVDKKGVFNFDDNLIPEMLPSIDLDSLRQAVLVDLTLFNEVHPENDGEPYLHFISGKSRSEFFKRALGCDPKLDNNRSIEQLRKAMISFFDAKNLKSIDRLKINEAVDVFLNRKAKDQNDKKVNVEDIEKVMNSVMPDDNQFTGDFVTFINVNQFTIDNYFEPSYTSGKDFGEIIIKDDDNDYSFQIDINSISKDQSSGKKVIYDESNGQIIVKLSRSGIEAIEGLMGKN